MKIGIKIGHFSRPDYVKEIAQHADFLEVYIIEGFDYSFLKAIEKDFVIHCAHQGHGVNFADPLSKETNIKEINAAKKAADLLDAKKIIFHPGQIANSNCNFKVAINTVLTNYDPRLVVENLPLTMYEDKYICASPKETELFIKKSKVGFCLDFCHAMEAATYLGESKGLFLEGFTKIKPCHFHINDFYLSSVFSTDPKTNSHLAIGDGELILTKLKKYLDKTSEITLETPLIFEGQVREIKLLKDLL